MQAASHLPPAAVFTVQETAKILKCSSGSVYTLIRKGELESINIGVLRRIRPADIEAFLAKVASPEPRRDPTINGKKSTGRPLGSKTGRWRRAAK